jgi:5-hydroxyisourate hydrolase
MTVITTHVLDLGTGRPAAGVPVVLERRDGTVWTPVENAVTDSDGRTPHLPGTAGHEHRLMFDVAAYQGRDAFFPKVTIVFRAADEDHLHVPLLLSRYGYSTYRGS